MSDERILEIIEKQDKNYLLGFVKGIQAISEEQKERIKYLENIINRKEEQIIELEQERIPYTNEYVEKLEKENEELKKQLENCYCNRTDCSGRIRDSKQYDSLVQKIENQQNEFIKYLNERYKDVTRAIGGYGSNTDMLYGKKDILEEILEEYKEIIGDVEDE